MKLLCKLARPDGQNGEKRSVSHTPTYVKLYEYDKILYILVYKSTKTKQFHLYHH